MFSAIFGAIKGIFSSGSVIEAATRGIDKAVFTEQEKKELHLNSLPLYEPFKLAQRVLAFMFVGVYLLTFSSYGILLVLDSAHAYQILDSVSQFQLHNIVWTIVAFYFAGGTINSVRQGPK